MLTANWRMMTFEGILLMAARTLPDVLGGEAVLGRSVVTSGTMAEMVREGLPAEALFRLAKRLDLRQAEISAKIGIPLRTLTRRMAHHARLTVAESDRTVRMAQVYANAVDTLGSEDKATQWLKTPNRALRGVRPLDQLDTDPGVREVEDILGRIAYGVYS
jgi:putative toxin-antitoxin system antitoxin component (TIGR02293 family)